MRLHVVMHKEGVKPDHATIIAVLTACSALALLRQGKSAHAIAIKTLLESSTSFSNALMTMYSRCGSVGESELVFVNLKSQDIVSWNTIIAGYLRGGMPNKALQAFGEMAKEHVRLDDVTLLNALVASARTGTVKVGRLCHALVVVNGIGINCHMGSSLISMYAKCGLVETVR